MKQIKAAVTTYIPTHTHKHTHTPTHIGVFCLGTAVSGYLQNGIPFRSRKFMLPQIYDFKS